MRMLSAFLAAPVLAGCATHYKTHDVLKSLGKVRRHVDEFAAKATADARSKNEIIATLIEAGAPAAQAPYDGLLTDAADMKDIAARIQALAARMDRIDDDCHV